MTKFDPNLDRTRDSTQIREFNREFDEEFTSVGGRWWMICQVSRTLEDVTSRTGVKYVPKCKLFNRPQNGVRDGNYVIVDCEKFNMWKFGH